MRESSLISVLLLAADSGEGAFGEMIDPVLRAKFTAYNIHCQAVYVSDLTKDQLDLFHVVILLRSPIPGHALDDMEDFRVKSVWLREYVERGGGLFLMFTECYGKTEEPLNELTAPWGLRLYFNQLLPDAAVAVERMPRFVESLILPFQVVPDSPLILPFRELGLIVEGGHGAQHLTLDGDSRWKPVLRGGPRILSKTYKGATSACYRNSSQQDIRDPVVCAAAEIGRGRVVAFPGSAPFWLVNSHIWRFQGLLQEQRDGAGFRFFCEAFRWLAHRSLPADVVERAAKAIDPKWLVRPGHFSFRPATAPLDCESQNIWIGPENEMPSGGYSAAFPLRDYRQLSATNWKDYLKREQPPGMFVLPGYELHDDEGVRSGVVSPESFPVHTMQYPNSTLLEAVWVMLSGCVSILREPLRNRIPPQRYGGYNLIEWDASPEWFAMYQRLIASKYSLGPIAFNGTTRVLVPRGSTAFDMMRKNRHSTYVSDGPGLETFTFTGPNLIDDEWEGWWLGYLPGETAELAVTVSSDTPLEEIVIYDGEEIFKRFEPGTTRFSRQLRFPLWRDHCLHLTARDATGKRIYATFPVYTRNRQFWGHVGSDQMNNYVNPMLPRPGGFIGVGTQEYEMFGFVTLGAAWGDYIRITPSMEYSQFMPSQEISGVLGSFNAHHPSPVLVGRDRKHYLNDHRRVFPFCGADAQAFTSEIAGEHIDNDERLTQTWHGKQVIPTRIFLPVPGATGRDEYVVWRWQPNGPVIVEITKHLTLDPQYLQEEWLTFASNSHYLIPGLRVGGVPISDLPAQDLGLAPNKEWDNSHYLRATTSLNPTSVEFQARLDIGSGEIGTFSLFTQQSCRAALFRSERELNVFFQCRPTTKIHYVIALDAGDLNLPVSQTIDVAGRDQVELTPGRWRVTGLPPGTTLWQDESGKTVFASQPQRGRSYHIIRPDMPRRYRLVQ